MNVIYCLLDSYVCVVKGYKKEHADDCKLPQQIEAKQVDQVFYSLATRTLSICLFILLLILNETRRRANEGLHAHSFREQIMSNTIYFHFSSVRLSSHIRRQRNKGKPKYDSHARTSYYYIKGKYAIKMGYL